MDLLSKAPAQVRIKFKIILCVSLTDLIAYIWVDIIDIKVQSQ